MRDADGAEGFIFIHAGVHGVGDLKPENQDWRNPVVQIDIRRIRGDGDKDHDD